MDPSYEQIDDLRALMTEIPEETIQVARAAFPKGNKLMTLRDALGPVPLPRRRQG